MFVFFFLVFFCFWFFVPWSAVCVVLVILMLFYRVACFLFCLHFYLCCFVLLVCLLASVVLFMVLVQRSIWFLFKTVVQLGYVLLCVLGFLSYCARRVISCWVFLFCCFVCFLPLFGFWFFLHGICFLLVLLLLVFFSGVVCITMWCSFFVFWVLVFLMVSSTILFVLGIQSFV